MGKGSSPQPPDYSALMRQDNAQQRSNTEYNTYNNRVSQQGPTGSTTWTNNPYFDQAGYDAAVKDWQTKNPQGTWVPGKDGYYQSDGSGEGGNQMWVAPTEGHWEGGSNSGEAAPDRAAFTRQNWTQTTTLSPEQQALYNQQVGVNSGRLGGAQQALEATNPGQGINTSGMVGYGTATNNGVPVGQLNNGQAYADTRQKVVDAIMSRQQPQLDDARTQAEGKLLNSGIEKGSDAWNREMTRLDQNQTDAQMQAYLAGGQEQSRLAGLDLAAGNFANNAAGQDFSQGLQTIAQNNSTRGQQFTEAGYQRQIPYQDLAALYGNYALTTPNLGSYYTSTGGNTGGTSNVDAAQQTYNAQVNRANANAQSESQAWAAGLSALAMFASDERLKTNIQTIGQHPAGVRRVKWDWKDGSGSDTGVIAQELQKVRPDAVVHMANGFLGVRYDLIGGR